MIYIIDLSLKDTNFINLYKNGIFSNFQDIWQYTPRFHLFNIDDCR